MRRSQLESLLGELARVTGRHEFAVIGSQCVHVVTDNVPAEVLMSLEVDVLLDPDDGAASLIDAQLGPDSAYRAEHAVFVDTVPASFPFLPDGWEGRAISLVAGSTRARCLEIHDLVLSKLYAGRLKDHELIAALFSFELADAGVISGRINQLRDPHLRAVLLARLQLVLENVGR